MHIPAKTLVIELGTVLCTFIDQAVILAWNKALPVPDPRRSAKLPFRTPGRADAGAGARTTQGNPVQIRVIVNA